MGVPRGRRKPLTWLLAGLFALAMLGALTVYRPFESRAGAVPIPGEEAGSQPAPLPGKRQTFLVMGVDKRPDDFGRADSMMVVSYDPASQRLAAISLARDTWVEIPGHGYDKLNHAYAYGGEKLAVQTVRRMLNIPIDYYVVVSFQGFAQIIDALGGVEIDVEKRMVYHDPYDLSMGPDGLVIDFYPGRQKMDGMSALKYARFRADEEGDVGRMRRQQQVVKAMVRAAAQPSAITKLPQLIQALSSTLETNLAIGDALRLATGAREALARPLATDAFSGEAMSLGGVFYFVPDLVKERKEAYETLVGEPAPEAFLARAREDQAAYNKALQEAMAEDERAAAAAAKEEDAPSDAPATQVEGDTAKGKPGDRAAVPKSPDKGQGDSPRSGARDRAEGEPSPQQPTTGQTQKGQTQQSRGQSLTVSVVDATGTQDLGATYVRKLKAAGFKVAHYGKASRPVPRTVALDRAGLPGTADRVKAVLPNALVVQSLDSNAPQAVEIVLGTDLLQSGTPKP